MKTIDFVKGLAVAYMDIGLSCRTAEQMINNLIVKYQTEEMMVDDRIIEEISKSNKAFSQIFKRFKEELSYQDKRELNGKQNIYNKKEQKAIAHILEENVGESLKSLTSNPQINPKIAEIHEEICKQSEEVVQELVSNHFFDECQLSINPHSQYYYGKSKDDIPEDLFKKKQNHPL